MVAIVSPSQTTASGDDPMVVNLTVTGTTGNYSYSYDVPHIISRETEAVLQVNLIWSALPTGYSAYMQDYACTDTNALIPESPAGSPFPAGTDSVNFALSLGLNQLISFAIFVVATDTSGTPTTIFCDPQIGNDPK